MHLSPSKKEISKTDGNKKVYDLAMSIALNHWIMQIENLFYNNKNFDTSGSEIFEKFFTSWENNSL